MAATAVMIAAAILGIITWERSDEKNKNNGPSSGQGQSASNETGERRSPNTAADRPPRDGNEPSEQPLHYLKSSCASSIGPDGFGSVTLDRDLRMAGIAGTIDVPCRVALGPGVRLTLSGVELRTRDIHFATKDGSANSSVVIEHSRLAGIESALIFVSLVGLNESVTLRNVTLDYGRRIAIDAPGKGPPPSKVDITDSTMLSLGPQSEGIVVVTRRANLERTRVETSSKKGGHCCPRTPAAGVAPSGLTPCCARVAV